MTFLHFFLVGNKIKQKIIHCWETSTLGAKLGKWNVASQVRSSYKSLRE